MSRCKAKQKLCFEMNETNIARCDDEGLNGYVWQLQHVTEQRWVELDRAR